MQDRARVTCTAKGHADCLGALLVFHEDNGRLAGSYWQAQCEKRDDSIRFLSLKLQEYTVPSSEYRSRRPHAGSVMASISEESSPVPSNSTNGASSSERPGVNPTALKAAERAFQALSDRHASLCEAVQTAEENALETEQNIQAKSWSLGVLESWSLAALALQQHGWSQFIQTQNRPANFGLPTWTLSMYLLCCRASLLTRYYLLTPGAQCQLD
ncbi:unnamed protein product [Effrenium voratum]|uniref:Uncharacterized protein n=1 Tax=Effrenium voratum TaxID=2562239 RepID=A0AA36J7U6_9DINO|nr:unnamed protein product [Effrenium voratum]